MIKLNVAKILDLMQERGLSVEDLPFTLSTNYRCLREEQRLEINTIRRLAEFLGVKPSEIINSTEDVGEILRRLAEKLGVTLTDIGVKDVQEV